MDDAQLIDSPRERPALTFVQFADYTLGVILNHEKHDRRTDLAEGDRVKYVLSFVTLGPDTLGPPFDNRSSELNAKSVQFRPKVLGGSHAWERRAESTAPGKAYTHS